MKLDDFDEKFTEPDMADVDEIPIMRSDVEPEEIKSYIADKLREFGAKLKGNNKSLLESLGYQGPDAPKKYAKERLQYEKGYNERNRELNTQIDKELSELQ